MPKNILVLVAVLFAGLSFSFAGEVPARLEKQSLQFTYSSNRSAYHCDYVVEQAKNVLTALGAQDVKVRCTGGLPYDTMNFVSAKFNSLQVVSEENATSRANEETVRLSFDESCDFNESLVDQLVKGFEVVKLKKNSSCWDSRGRVKYEITVLK